jgi:hypothetical protein
MTWAGDSQWRRFVAWLGQTAILVTAAALLFATIWFVLTPWMIDNFTQVIRNTAR